MSSAILLEDIFDIKEVDKDGKKFDKVSRLECRSENYELDLVLDINTDVYPMEAGNKFSLALASTLHLDGKPDEGVYDQSNYASLADKYEYVMYGKVFKYTQESSSALRVAAVASFGGLLMQIKGDPRNLQSLQVDSRIYLLMRKV
eukprot:tig00000718_g3714.t1